MKKYSLLLLFLLSSLLFAACNGDTPAATQPTAGQEAYPIEDEDVEVKAETGYPIEEENLTTYAQGPEFSIDEPVIAGALIVTGNGPAGVPLNLVDASEVGALLAETVIETNGTFTFNLTDPLPEKHMIGLQLGDLTGTDLNENDFVYSDTYFVRPLIGVLFDLVTVQ